MLWFRSSNKIMNKLLIKFIAISVLFFISCKNDAGIPYVKFDESTYKSAKEKWQSLKSKNYSFTYMISSDATGPDYPKVAVTVVDDISSYEIIAETEEDKNRFDEWDARFVSAEYLFDFIWDLYEEAKEYSEKRPDGLVYKAIEVLYDKNTGFPISIKSYGQWKASALTEGDWWSLMIIDIDVK